MQQKLRSFFCTIVLGCSALLVNAQADVIQDNTNSNNDTLPSKYQQAQLVWKDKTVSYYSLPQDRMPCLVPNKKSVSRIYNWKRIDSLKVRAGIPNASPVYKLIPDNSSDSIPTLSYSVNSVL